MNLANPLEAMTWVLRIASCGVLLVTVETLVRRDVLRDEGLMSWPVGKLRKGYLVRKWVGDALEMVLRYPNICVLLAVRAVLAAAMVLAPAQAVRSPWLLFPMALLVLLFAVRHPYGQDGADQMAVIIFIGAALATLGRGQLPVIVYLWFLALQICLAYATAGIAKATAAGWRDGTFLVGVVATKIYGHEQLAAALAERPVLSRSLSRMLVAWESVFPIVLLVPRPIGYVMVASGFLFHLSNAFLMGLNDFFWMFVATYPALLYCIHSRGW